MAGERGPVNGTRAHDWLPRSGQTNPGAGTLDVRGLAAAGSRALPIAVGGRSFFSDLTHSRPNAALCALGLPPLPCVTTHSDAPPLDDEPPDSVSSED